MSTPAHSDPTPRAWRRVDAHGQRNHGAVSRLRAVDGGVDPRALSRQAARMGWRRPHRGVYTLPGTRDTFLREAAAACLAVGDRALVTGDGALLLYGIIDRRPDEVELVVPATARPRQRRKVRLVRTRAYDDIAVRMVQSLPVATPMRAIADVAPRHVDIRLARRMARSIALRHATLADARAELARRQRFPGRGHLRRALHMLEGELTHSGAERVGRGLLVDAGLRPYPRPYPILVDDAVVAEADIAIVHVLYDIEIDGPHHDLPEQVRADKARDRLLGRRGWTVDRYPVEFVLEQPRSFVREVLARVRQLERAQGSQPRGRH